MPFLSMNHDNEYQERRAQSEYGDQKIIFSGLLCQHDGSSRRLAWDPDTAVFDSSTTNTDEMANFFLFGVYSWDS